MACNAGILKLESEEKHDAKTSPADKHDVSCLLTDLHAANSTRPIRLLMGFSSTNGRSTTASRRVTTAIASPGLSSTRTRTRPFRGRRNSRAGGVQRRSLSLSQRIRLGSILAGTGTSMSRPIIVERSTAWNVEKQPQILRRRASQDDNARRYLDFLQGSCPTKKRPRPSPSIPRQHFSASGAPPY